VRVRSRSPAFHRRCADHVTDLLQQGVGIRGESLSWSRWITIRCSALPGNRDGLAVTVACGKKMLQRQRVDLSWLITASAAPGEPSMITFTPTWWRGPLPDNRIAPRSTLPSWHTCAQISRARSPKGRQPVVADVIGRVLQPPNAVASASPASAESTDDHPPQPAPQTIHNQPIPGSRLTSWARIRVRPRTG
jgi:hypothetical protein